jgi:hypothetical protein
MNLFDNVINQDVIDNLTPEQIEHFLEILAPIE